ncbi:DUF2187 family protein [Halalkalibacterium halodurans]|jgi:uncharacterized protein YkvS|uniref:BH2182 protein n=2 Tax=Halalkalibacterium halodurans TaxID=86665 RepID=Q9KAV4_HALH5|nr:DUF2187 family protein [Halalkalibacterium halodurans]MDY7222738.1 DUF2187 family protein [Halalkalibacterium halodurans]MDY7241959.1 DUF2187 family protein [Halalkalibacterium halodurans]MED3646951.1 DUF2187 family protein [Halalkalibacterium halodurans]MED4082776.1 DUF2187 family protein [Halalkalibacterium halodurans]MED4087254.1 DUF2187 family protein [Halalkalibacterium halodurans]
MAEEKQAIDPLAIAQEREVILFKGHKMKVLAIHTNSVVAEFLDYPIPGEEETYPHSRTVINHRNYERTFKTVDGEVITLEDEES